jgi:hypothetical protein
MPVNSCLRWSPITQKPEVIFSMILNQKLIGSRRYWIWSYYKNGITAESLSLEKYAKRRIGKLEVVN